MTKPTIKPGDGIFHERHDHPAFGTIVLTQTQGGGAVMFGSNVAHHMGRLRIEIHTAGFYRDHGHDRVYPERTLVALEMTHAQFAAFITGVGKGEGTPCTLLDYPLTAAVSAPPIDELKTRAKSAEEHVKNVATKQAAKVAKIAEQLTALIGGKYAAKDLRGLVRDLESAVDNLPDNLAYATHVAEEALEEATAAAKIEVEAFVDTTAKRLGLENIKELGRALPAPEQS